MALVAVRSRDTKDATSAYLQQHPGMIEVMVRVWAASLQDKTTKTNKEVKILASIP